MAENIREVIARMKSNQQSSQISQNKPAPIPKPVRIEEMDDGEDDYTNEEDEIPIPVQSPVEKLAEKPQEVTETRDPQTASAEQQVFMEIEMLQNTGRFRVELLHQLQEINKALVVIAGTLVDLSQNGKK